MSDLFGHSQPKQEFRDIKNQRPSVAEQKAELCLILKDLVNKCPPSIASGSIQQTRAWVAAQQSARKKMNNQRSSVQDLTAAIANMRSFL